VDSSWFLPINVQSAQVLSEKISGMSQVIEIQPNEHLLHETDRSGYEKERSILMSSSCAFIIISWSRCSIYYISQ